MRNKTFLVMTLAASTFLLASCFESEAQNSDAQDQSATAANAQSTLTGVYCQKAEDKNTSLAVIEDDNGNLRFSISVWNNQTGNDCGVVNETALKTGDGQWLYSAEDSAEDCSVTITNQNGLTFAQQGACRAMCGMNAEIGEVSVSNVEKTSAEVTQSDLESLYETPICN